MKLLIKILAGLLILVVVVFGGVLFYLDRIVQEAVVRIGPQVTGTEVKLESVDLGLFDGRIVLEGFTLGNPEGYQAEELFSLGSIDVQLDTSTLNDDVLIINHIDIQQPVINYEATRQGNNLNALQANIAERTGGDDGDEQDDESGGSRKVIIDRLTINGGEISARHFLLAGQQVSIPLPNLEMNDLGRKSNGTTLAEVSSQVLVYISQQASRAVANSDQLKGLLSGVQDQLQERIGDLEDERNKVEEVGDRIRGLLDNLGN